MDEDCLKWVPNGKKIFLLLKQFHENRHSKDVQNEALMRRDGGNG